MAGAVFRRLPFVAGPDDAPMVRAVRVVVQRLLCLQFVGGEFAAKAHVVEDADGFIEPHLRLSGHARQD